MPEARRPMDRFHQQAVRRQVPGPPAFFVQMSPAADEFASTGPAGVPPGNRNRRARPVSARSRASTSHGPGGAWLGGAINLSNFASSSFLEDSLVVELWTNTPDPACLHFAVHAGRLAQAGMPLALVLLVAKRIHFSSLPSSRKLRVRSGEHEQRPAQLTKEVPAPRLVNNNGLGHSRANPFPRMRKARELKEKATMFASDGKVGPTCHCRAVFDLLQQPCLSGGRTDSRLLRRSWRRRLATEVLRSELRDPCRQPSVRPDAAKVCWAGAAS